MQVAEIARLSGKDKEEVANHFGIEAEGTYWFKTVDDAEAQAYIAEEPSEGSEGAGTPEEQPKDVQRRIARFWSPTEEHFLPTGDDSRKDIKFHGWAYETDDDSPEAEFLRRVDIRDRIAIREILDHPYKDTGMIVLFRRYLESLVFTGVSRADGPSRAGIRCVRSMLSKDDQVKLETTETNDPALLVEVVASRKSMNAEAFGME